jgi:asparagine synthase (glutamine-hydrolysing)
MCGIAGVFGFPSQDSSLILEKLSSALKHRGPDHLGTWSDSELPLHLAHTRLSIIDVSSAGNQPMVSNSARYVITFNGEIYNFKDLNQSLALAGVQLKSSSDTETLLEHIDLFGIEKTLQAIDGMFAFGLWDRKEKELHLARDRFGEKPLQYGFIEGRFIFCSEMRFKDSPIREKLHLDPEAIAMCLKHGYIPHPWTIYSEFKKVPPGSWLTFRPSEGRLVSSRKYFDINSVFRDEYGKPKISDLGQAVEEFGELLQRNVKRRFVSDVPLGVFLSGGIDSSSVVAAARASGIEQILTYNVSFGESEYDESIYASQVAEKSRTDHTTLRLDPDKATGILDEAVDAYDEPFMDSSLLPTFLISREFSKRMKVAVTGDGADELFCGYSRYKDYASMLKFYSLPSSMRKAFLGKPLSLMARLPESSYQSMKNLFPPKYRFQSFTDKLIEASDLLSDDASSMLDRISAHHGNELHLVSGSQSPRFSGIDSQLVSALSPERAMMYYDLHSYLPGDILTKVDRAAMSNGLETRTPFLEEKMLRFSIRLSDSLLPAKRVMRSYIRNHYGEILSNRPKKGFSIPLEQWTRTTLKDRMLSRLNAAAISKFPYLDSKKILAMTEQHYGGQRNYATLLWSIWNLMEWSERNHV